MNKSVFWVTDSLLNDWIQLPDATPEQLMVSRLLKHVFTGNLNGTIDSCPPFPGKERHLLRCQLARIQHAAEICPKGMYEIDEETGDEKIPEEVPALGIEELKSLEAWGHRYPIILKAGRCSHKAPAGLDEEAQAAWAEKMAEEDKTEERFKALNEDVPIKGLESAWIVKTCGDTQSYASAKGEGNVSYAINMIKSLRWPGAFTVAKGGNYCSIYVGDGIKRGDFSYDPTEPPEVQKDPLDQIERPEPTPLEAPEEPAEPDTDKEDVPADGEEEN